MKNQRFLPDSEFFLKLRAKAAVEKALRPRKKLDAEQLETVNAVLEQVQGSYVCAAKLLDMTYARLKNVVNGNPRLKLKWGKGKGRPKGLRFELRIKPYLAPMPYLEPWRGDLLLNTKRLIVKHLSPDQIDELSVWLEWAKAQRDPKRDEQQSMTEWIESGKAA